MNKKLILCGIAAALVLPAGQAVHDVDSGGAGSGQQPGDVRDGLPARLVRRRVLEARARAVLRGGGRGGRRRTEVG